ncbi:hypothetical protein Pcinc_010620 [Petrolisthes cinctipes]|uniref:Uncharacterized protein n=1 Tax=Petrolisthes cinctipes TaxID=88211 RepID=A0AAE1G8M9_PETCI|nr:hypothetical protein Pcinc_010620 [Petrolisthes cinctipes]
MRNDYGQTAAVVPKTSLTSFPHEEESENGDVQDKPTDEGENIDVQDKPTDEVLQAKQKEINNWQDNNVYEEVEDVGQKTLSVRLTITLVVEVGRCWTVWLRDYQLQIYSGMYHQENFIHVISSLPMDHSLQMIAAQVVDEGEVICEAYNELGENNLDIRGVGVRVCVYGGKECNGDGIVEEECHPRDCPAGGGQECDDDPLQLNPCSNPPCLLDGKWSAWGGWSVCSVKCDKGEVCNNPIPSNGGHYCPWLPLSGRLHQPTVDIMCSINGMINNCS